MKLSGLDAAVYTNHGNEYDIMVKLYHGTSERFLGQILSKGIRPRRKSVGNWEKFPSRSDMVYLTTAYPFYFAQSAIKEEGERILVLEIDTQNLNEDNLYPDEDFVAQVVSFREKKSLDEVHPVIRKQLGRLRHLWEDSIDRLGNCAHKGSVPASSITRYVLFDYHKRIELSMMAADPSISILNYALCKRKYINLVEWMFGDTDVIYDSVMDFSQEQMEQLDSCYKKRLEYWQKVSKDRTGIEVVTITQGEE